MQGLSWHFAQDGCVARTTATACASQTGIHGYIPRELTLVAGFATAVSFRCASVTLCCVLGWVATPSCVFGDVVHEHA